MLSFGDDSRLWGVWRAACEAYSGHPDATPEELIRLGTPNVTPEEIAIVRDDLESLLVAKRRIATLSDSYQGPPPPQEPDQEDGPNWRFLTAEILSNRGRRIIRKGDTFS